MRDALFLAVSQSGRSPDILNLAQAGRDDGALTVALVNDTSSPLASTCEVVLPLHAGPEKSVAATKSFIAALAAGFQLVAHWSQDQELLDALDTLPDVLARASATDWSAAVPHPDGSRQPLRRRPRRRLRGGAGGCAQAQGNLGHPCGGDERRRADARPLDAGGRPLPDPGAQPAGRDPERRQRSRDEAEGAGRPRHRRRSGGRPGDRDAALGRGRASLSCADRPDPELLSSRERHCAWAAAAIRTILRACAR